MVSEDKSVVLPKFKESSSIYCFKESGTYKWTIHNFSFAFDNDCNDENAFSSRMFSMGINREFDWDIKLYPSLTKAEKYITVKVGFFNNFGYEKVQAECRISILGKNIVRTVKTKSPYNFTINDWQENFVKLDYLLNEENGLLIKDKLSLFCQIDISGYCEIHKHNSVGYANFVNRLQVSKDLELLMNNNSHDIFLVLNNEKYYVHKCVLASQSPVFSAMFDHCMQEQMNGEVVLTDISDDALKKLIHFMYTGIILDINEISKETLRELLVAADKYELNDLKEICEMLFYNLLNISNAIETIILADFHNAEKLKYATAHFILSHIKEFNKTSEFELFSKSYSQLLPKFVEISEGSAFNSVLAKSDYSDFDESFTNPYLMEFTSEKKNCWSVTQLAPKKDTYTWKINNFSYFFDEEHPRNSVISNSFGIRDNCSWQMHLYPKGFIKEIKGYISLFIKFLSDNKKVDEIKARYKFFIIDNEGQKRNIFKSNVFIFIPYGEILGENKFLEKKFLMKNKDKLLPNDTLTIVCNVYSSFSSESIRTDANYLKRMHFCIPKYQYEISKKQIKLLESGKFSDLTLVAANKKFQVHQSILSIRCPAFFNMISGKLTKDNTVIEINDVSPSVLESFLIFIYSGNVDCLNLIAKDLYVEAKKYNVENLKDICETYLCKNLTLENVCDCFVFAHVNVACQLKFHCTDFIVNNIQKVCATSGYSSLANSRPQLLKDIICKL